MTTTKSFFLWPANRIGRIRLLTLLVVLAVVAYLTRGTTLFLITRTPVLYHYIAYHPQEGDIMFQSLPHNDLADAIEGVTHSTYSHCGVVLRNEKGQWVVIEAIFDVHETPLFLWELRGREGNFAVYRLDPRYASSIPKFKEALVSRLGQPYDFNYDMTNGSAVYCSDLIYLAFERASGEKLGQLEKLGDLDWKPYERFIRSDQQGLLPLDRLMITPASLARAPQLQRVE